MFLYVEWDQVSISTSEQDKFHIETASVKSHAILVCTKGPSLETVLYIENALEYRRTQRYKFGSPNLKMILHV